MTRISEITERVAKATPGPWQRSGGRQKLGEEDCIVVGPDSGWLFATPIGRKDRPEQHAQAFVDADMVAHAPSDLAYLLAEVAELKLCLREAHDFILDKCSEHDMAPTIGRIERALTGQPAMTRRTGNCDGALC